MPLGCQPNMADLLSGAGLAGVNPEQIAEQMRNMFGGNLPGQQPPSDPSGENADNSNRKPEDKDKDKKGPDGSGSGGAPSYFS